jgi:hypothetical protein
MLKRWRWLALASLALAACSSGPADSGSPTTAPPGSNDGVLTPVAEAPTSAASVGAPATVADNSPSTSIAQPSIEYVTPGQKVRLKVTYPIAAPVDERAKLDAYVRFLRMTDVVGETNDPSNPEIDQTSTAGVNSRTKETAERGSRTGHQVRGFTEHVIDIEMSDTEQTQVVDCFFDGAGIYAFDGSAVVEPSGRRYLARAVMATADGGLKVRSFWTEPHSPC